MSRSLAALRRIFGDELVVRLGGGYRLTPRAERLQCDLVDVLRQLGKAFTEAPYDPLTVDCAFRVAGPGYVPSVIGAAFAAFCVNSLVKTSARLQFRQRSNAA